MITRAIDWGSWLFFCLLHEVLNTQQSVLSVCFVPQVEYCFDMILSVSSLSLCLSLSLVEQDKTTCYFCCIKSLRLSRVVLSVWCHQRYTVLSWFLLSHSLLLFLVEQDQRTCVTHCIKSLSSSRVGLLVLCVPPVAYCVGLVFLLSVCWLLASVLSLTPSLPICLCLWRTSKLAICIMT